MDAVPDITPVQVVVNAKVSALDPQQIEKVVSFPIESELRGIPHVQAIRSLSKYGLSQVIIVFDDGTDIYWARQQISERLQNMRDKLPQGVSAELAPITTGLGEILMYAVLAKPGSLLERQDEKSRLMYLRTIQDFSISRYLKTHVSGIAEVDSNGGYKKEIHVDINPQQLESKGLVLNDVIQKLKTLGESFGGGTIQYRDQQVIVKTQGSVTQLEQIMNMTVSLNLYGQPVRVKDVAVVREDYSQRLGAATYDARETVLGTVLMLSGANSKVVASDVEQALKEIPLPTDVLVKVLYTRTALVDATTHTITKNLAEGALLVILVLLLVLGNLRAALLVSLAIPISMLLAALGMRYWGVSANLMSLGAIDFGLLVDGSVVIVENVFRRLTESQQLSRAQKQEVVLEAVKEVAPTVLMGLLLIMAVYMPILALDGVEGKLFRPMVLTVLMALGASLLVALVLVPVLAQMVLSDLKGSHAETRLFVFLKRLYQPVLEFVLQHKAVTLVPIVLLSVGSFGVFSKLGADFMPALNEGDMVIALSRSNSSLNKSIELQKRSEQVIAQFGEVEHVFSRIGTAETATDPMGVHLSDTFVILKTSERTRSKENLFTSIKKALSTAVPGQEAMPTQPIEMRFNEILEGSRADISLKIYGPDLEELINLSDRSQKLLKQIRGTSEVQLDALTALRKSPVLNVKLNPEQIVRYGVDISEVNRSLESAMAGYPVGSFYEASWRFPVVVRLDEKYRDNPNALKELQIGLPDRGVVSLSKLSEITEENQVTTIAHDQGQRFAGIAVNLRGRDMESFVAQARQELKNTVKFPEGYRLSWGGQFKNLERSKARLVILIPLILIAIFVVMLRHFGGFKRAVIVYLSIPFAMTGGILSLAIREIPFSVSAAIGFIALSGIAILNAMVLVTFFNQLRSQGVSLMQAVTEGSLVRLRPVLMTALVASLGFIPMALNTGTGSEVQRPLATVVIGGLITSTLLTLLVIPMLYLWVEQKREN